jgi:hypothetical protein
MGTGEGVGMSDQLPTLFPGLRTTTFQITSPIDDKYNCIAWAASDAGQWWWPVGDAPSVVWPPAVPREATLDAFAAAFLTLGYVRGADDSLEPGWEKVGLFADAAGIPTHAARQLASGRWTSKLGQAEDIEHELRAVEGEIYGAVVLILKRPAPPG